MLLLSSTVTLKLSALLVFASREICSASYLPRNQGLRCYCPSRLEGCGGRRSVKFGVLVEGAGILLDP